LQPLIICAAVTGGAPARAKTPHHPVTPSAVADAAVASWRAGAAIVHIHARHADETTSSDVAAYRDTVERIRAAGCDAILSLSAGDDGGKSDHAQRLRVVEVGEELVSLDLGPINLGARLYDNRPSYLREIAKRMLDRRIKPEIDVLDSGHLDSLALLIKDGLVKPPFHVQLVFGVPGGLPADVRLLPLLVSRLPPESEWSISCQTADPATFLRFQMAAFVDGGHVRTGMEDYVYVRPGELAKSNEEMVAQWTETARIWGRPVASPAQARRMLGLPERSFH
jgi:3-keto-5-aminohexanoate cleavage enzyme